MKRLVLILVVALLSAALAFAQTGGSLKRTLRTGGVTVRVTPTNLSDPLAATIDFQVVMDAHAGDLGFDLTQVATLSGETGSVSPSAWSGGRGGHHLEGILSFPASALRRPGPLTLTLRDVSGDKDLSFVWEIPVAATGKAVRVAVEGGFYTNISPIQLREMLKSKDFFLVNTHVPYEGELDRTDSFIPFDLTASRISEFPAEKAANIVLYCRSGRMSDIAARILVKSGFSNISNLDGGMIAWEKAGFSLEFAGGKGGRTPG
jgi:rhodanese-related sulfurtransferase